MSRPEVQTVEGSASTREAALFLFGHDGRMEIDRLNQWAYRHMGPPFWKASNSKQAHRRYSWDELRAFKGRMTRPTVSTEGAVS
jgi:hypothetical protein